VTRAAPTAGHVADADIARAIEAVLLRRHDAASVVTLTRRPWEYATSTALELVNASLDTGANLEFVLKHPAKMSERARRAKPSFVVDPQREVEVYRRLLVPLQVGARVVGFLRCHETGGDSLLADRVDGRPLYEIGDLQVWTAVARWLATLHQRLGALDTASLRRDARLLQYDRNWYTEWMTRALRFLACDDRSSARDGRSALRWLADRYDKVIDRLMSLPTGIIHGEFYPSNVIVTNALDESLVCPVDWEMAAVAPRIVDLAALTSGGWRVEDRREMVAAYLAASGSSAGATLHQVAQSVEYAQIHLAVQWLGWFGRRRAAREHTRDWLSDAVERAETLRL
jgi:hypothetical protein